QCYSSSICFSLVTVPRPPTSTLFPYTTLFRSAPSSPRAPLSNWPQSSTRTPGASSPRCSAWSVRGAASPRPDRRAPPSVPPHEPRQPDRPDPPSDRTALARPRRVQPRQQLQLHDLPGGGADPLVQVAGRGLH